MTNLSNQQQISYIHTYVYIYLENANQSKYNTVLKSLNQQKSFGNDQYPLNITDAKSILNIHKFDWNHQNKRCIWDNVKQNIKEQMKEEQMSLIFAQIEGKFYVCGKDGHKSPQCQLKNKSLEKNGR